MERGGRESYMNNLFMARGSVVCLLHDSQINSSIAANNLKHILSSGKAQSQL